MNGFPGVDRRGAVRVGMVQSKYDVSRPYFAYKSCKAINVKGADGLWIRLLDASMASSGQSLARDYAVVARVHVKVAGEPVIVFGRNPRRGTEAAGEVVSNPA